MSQRVPLRWQRSSSRVCSGFPATSLVPSGRKHGLMLKEPGFLPGCWITGTANTVLCISHEEKASRSPLPASVDNMKHQRHMLLFLLGLLLICIIIRKLLPTPNEQRGFKHLPWRENRWFISLTGRKDWHMLSILYPLLWSDKVSSVGKDH